MNENLFLQFDSIEMPSRKLALILLFYFSCFLQTYGQAISSAELKLSCLLNTSSSFLPKELLSTKTIVIISIHEENNTQIRGDWEELSEAAHFYISRLGIDPVVYYYVDDMIAGYDVTRAITAEMLQRDIKNILLLSKDDINGRPQYIGVITAFNQQPSFVSHSQSAWKSQTSDLEILFRNLARSIDNADLVKENLLILEKPEFFSGVKILKGRRSETFNTDLRIDQIAIPVFEQLPLPENSTAGNIMLEAINEKNEENLRKNAELEQIMSRYPYNFKILPYQYDERKLLTQGCQFVLLKLTSSGRNVRRMLGYEVNDQVDELITMRKDELGNVQVKAIPIDAMVTKYYVKHINSGDVYLGEQWDGDDNWSSALKNHLNLLLEKLAE
jgi:hypothetical protein